MSKVRSPLACRNLVLGDLHFSETEAREKLVLIEKRHEVGKEAAKELAKKLAESLIKDQEEVNFIVPITEC